MLSKMFAYLEPAPKQPTQSNRRNSDSSRALEPAPEMQMVGSFNQNASPNRAHGVARSSSVAASPFPQQIREQQESRLRENQRVRKDSQINNKRSTSRTTPAMPVTSNYLSNSTDPSTNAAKASPVIPAATPSQDLTLEKRNYFGIAEADGTGSGESLTDWENVSKSSTTRVTKTGRSSSELRTTRTTPPEETNKRVVESSRRRTPGSSTDDEQGRKSDKQRMAREIETLMKEKAQLLADNEQLKKEHAKSQEKLVFADQQIVEDRHTIDALNMQVSSLKQVHLQLSEHLKIVEGQAQQFQNYCNEVQQNYGRLESEAKMLRDKAREADEMRARLDQVRWAEEQLRRYEQYTRELKDKNQRLETDVKLMKDKTREAEEREGQLQALLDVRTSDLKGAKTFLTMEDKFSGADVLKMVEGLNAEIFQASAYIAGLVEDVPKEQMKRFTWKQCMSQDAFNLVQKRVGPALMDFIEEKGPENRRDPLALQLAFQAFLVWWSAYMVNSFADGPTGHELGILYKAIRETETQAVSARWRAITSEKMTKMSKATFTNFIGYSIAGILKMGGATLPQSGKSYHAIQDSIMVIEKVWKQIRAAVKEGIISCDVELTFSDPGADFDPATMDDSYKEESPSLDLNGVETVLCPVAIGVKRTTMKRGDDGNTKPQDELLLKPKVVLSSVFSHIGDFTVLMDETMIRELQDGK
ncbi:hypothetical protein CVT24_001154 [Panaeolus cyanescens]|uniref:Uncharacterized protein n=1 Tax=Panaeolus cyanescens TaxID=181874 RepID=A0A409W7B6_9AGAR|nr:hypothetical protein CVT24_001154 [Panaeolus cyanescens]